MKLINDMNTSEKGLSMVEILTSIVILALIFISIITILNLTAKSNKTSEKIIDATYIAQQEMEYIYEKSLDETSELETIPEYAKQSNDGNWFVYHKNIANSDYFLEIKEDRTEFPMVRVVVKVYDVNDISKTEPKAQMETLLKWGGYHS